MKILIIGGDGYLGWPTAMFLAKKKYQVFLTDNFSKRKNVINKNDELLQIFSIGVSISDLWFVKRREI